MAKISANGDKEVRRWKRDDGAVMVLTAKGRLLRKFQPGEGYNVIAKDVVESGAEDWAIQLGYEEVKS